MTRVVDPTLADMRFEGGRRAWRGYLSLARALVMHAIFSTPATLRRAYFDDQRAVPRAALMTLTTSLAVALPFVLIPILGPVRASIGATPEGIITPRSARTIEMLFLLFPQALVVTLPSALLVALPSVMRRHRLTPHLLRRLMGVAVLACVAMGVLVNWGAPLANQGFRVIVSGNPRVPRGANETTLTDLRHRIESLRRNTVASPEVINRVRSGLEYRYQLRLALIASPIPLTLAAVALAATSLGRRQPVMIGSVAGAGYIIAIFRLDAEASRFVPFVSVIAAGLVAWLPLLLLTVLALGTLRGRYFSLSATPANPCTTLPPPGSSNERTS